ncbi:MAG: agmatinase [Solirubrobacteraceae bacterium]
MRATAPRFGPPDASIAPRYTGPRTFARLPHVPLPESGVDVAVIGVPFDTATSFRPGARFGPEAVRSASALLRPYHPVLAVDVFAALSAVDGGDLATTPGNAQRSAQQIHEGLAPVLDAGIVPLVIGGDHSIVLGELRAHAAAHGPVGLVLLDAHADTWDQYYGERYFHGTPFRRAVEEGLLDPSRSLLAGMRGPLYGAADLVQPREMGFEIVAADELTSLTPAQYGERVRARIGDGPVYMSFDIDVLDPAFAPGTGTPEAGGLHPREALSFIRALAGIEFCGYDVVEVSPPYDTAGQTTALNAATIAYEMLALLAVARQSSSAATTRSPARPSP